jgi:hypothetical protein
MQVGHFYYAHDNCLTHGYRMRFEKGATTQDAIPYLEPSQDIMLAHCISEHPAAWQRLRDTTAH